jgi:hypothetical protein
MKKIYNYLLVLILLCIQAFTAQAQFAPEALCGTAEPSDAHYKYIESLNQQYNALDIEADSNGTIYLPIKFHVVTDINGSRYDQNTLLTVFCELNQKFQGSGIQFYMRGDVNVINNSLYYRHTSNAVGSALMNEHNVIRSINTYFVDLSAIGLCGYAYFPGSGPGGPLREGGLMMSIGCSQVGNTTLAHEMGHYLALPHTFDGSSTDPISPFAERVTRNPNEVAPRFSANCNTFGDRYCDTPADIYGFRWNCNGMALNDTDLNGDTFLPDAGYFMSYSSDFCMNKFSQQQMNTMRQTVRSSSTTPAPRNYLTVFPMPAWDTVTSNVTLLEPLASSTPSPSNFIFFRWSKAPGATHYFVRIRRNNLPVTEFTTTDTTRLFTINLLQPGLTYTYTIRPYNHGWTCVGPSQTGTFTTTQGYGVSVFDPKSQEVVIYPSLLEAGQLLNIRSGEAQLQSFSLVDIQGRTVMQAPLESGSIVHQIQMPVLPAGTYHVKLQSSQGPLFERIVIQ